MLLYRIPQIFTHVLKSILYRRLTKNKRLWFLIVPNREQIRKGADAVKEVI